MALEGGLLCWKSKCMLPSSNSTIEICPFSAVFREKFWGWLLPLQILRTYNNLGRLRCFYPCRVAQKVSFFPFFCYVPPNQRMIRDRGDSRCNMCRTYAIWHGFFKFVELMPFGGAVVSAGRAPGGGACTVAGPAFCLLLFRVGGPTNILVIRMIEIERKN